MKRPGDILRKRREELGLSLLELENSSNIPRRSLEALERDQYDFFASESYYIGFIKNYAESLRLDPEILLNAYQAVKMIESPLPLEALIGNSRRRFSLWLLAPLILLPITGLISYFFMHNSPPPTITTKFSAEAESQISEDPAIILVNRYPWMQKLEDGILLRLVLDEVLNEPQKGVLQPELKVSRVADGFKLVSLNLHQNYELNLSIGKTNILPVHLANLADSENLDAKIQSLYLDFTLQDVETILINLNKGKDNKDFLNNSQEALSARFEAFQQQSQKSIPHAILQSRAPILLRLQMKFLRDSYIRYQWFGQDAQEFPVLKNKSLLLQGKAPLTIWLSDVDAIKIKVNGQDLVPEAFQNVFIGRLEWKREAGVARLYLNPGN